MGCFRKGEAEDPVRYVTGVAEILTHYPEDVVLHVTNAFHGLPSQSQWLPTMAEVKAACEKRMEPVYRDLQRDKLFEGRVPEQPSEESRRRVAEHWERMRPEIKNAGRVAFLSRAQIKRAAEERLVELERHKNEPIPVSEALKANLVKRSGD